MKDFRSLQVWQKSHALVLEIYRLTTNFPKYEIYGLTGQTRRAATSIPTNIAEGCGRSGDVEFARYLQISMGSACELEYHALLAHDLGYIPAAEYEALHLQIVETKRMLTALLNKLRATKHATKFESDSDR